MTDVLAVGIFFLLIVFFMLNVMDIQHFYRDNKNYIRSIQLKLFIIILLIK